MLNVKVLKRFRDTHTKELYRINDIFNISESRYNEISLNMKMQGADVSNYLEILDIEDIDVEDTPEGLNEATEGEDTPEELNEVTDGEDTPEGLNEATEGEDTPEELNEVTDGEDTPEELNNKKNKRSKK